MPASLRISAKSLGAAALPSFCPRCFWIQMHAEGLPYQIFPGIFSSIDSYGKRLVHAWFDHHQSAPPWLAALGDLKGYRPPPHFSKFSTLDGETGIVLRGTPDGILVRRDGSHVIVDYKTAKFTAHQDELFPMYEAQLNAYAFIAEQCGFSPVSGLALLYTEPVTDNAAAAKDANLTAAGFVMAFSTHILPVDLAPERILKLLVKVREIYDRNRPPDSREGCEDCALLKNLIAVASR
jgi:hypothetical protein